MRMEKKRRKNTLKKMLWSLPGVSLYCKKNSNEFLKKVMMCVRIYSLLQAILAFSEATTLPLTLNFETAGRSVSWVHFLFISHLNLWKWLFTVVFSKCMGYSLNPLSQCLEIYICSQPWPLSVFRRFELLSLIL